MSAGAKIADALSRFGRPMTLKRRLTATTFDDVTVSGVLQGYRPNELMGGVQQGDSRVTISNAEIAAKPWPGPPKKGDFVQVDGRTLSVQGCETKYLGTDVLAHVLWCRG